MRYDLIRSPRRLRLCCSLDGSPADDAHHLNLKGMGGRGPKADADNDDATPLCRKCHNLRHDGLMALWRGDDGLLRYRLTEIGARRLRRRMPWVTDGLIYTALYEGMTLDDMPDIPRKE